jgi:hypothetical protein
MPAKKTLVAMGKNLRNRGEDITHQPLPRRWVDLIHYLDEQERLSSERSKPRAESAAATVLQSANSEVQTRYMSWEELREVAWLASVITGLSLAGVGLAVALATVSG